jgi:hypothetical protein
LSIVEACDAARLSRAGFCRHFDEHAPRQAEFSGLEFSGLTELGDLTGERTVIGDSHRSRLVLHPKSETRLGERNG